MKFTLKIDTAIEVLQKNLNEHIAELQEASAGWTEQMIAALQEFRDALTRQGLRTSGERLHQLLYQRPKDSRPEYSNFLGALKRAEQDGQTTVEFDEIDYDKIFNDNWDWRVSSKASNSGYTRSK